MAYTFSKKSLKKLEGVDERLVGLAEMAISVSDIDFGISEGLRTKERQQILYDTKRSQTLNSKHIIGKALDVFAFVDGEVCWELAVYDDIADAFAMASRAHGVPLKWGCAWTVSDIGTWNGTMEQAMNSYIDIRRSQDRRPFLDGPHFELSD
tara:strand:- start:5953 stop:6408 length:456 start_codon:yes stop_codon:yes gene_type:complete